MSTYWQSRYAQRVEGMVSSTVREILKVTKPDVISFAGGLPSPDAFRIDAIKAAACRLLESRGAQALQYSTTEGFPPLPKFIVEKMSRYGIVANEGNVLMTTGSQQALDLIGKILLDPGDTILCEVPTYLGAIQAFRSYQARFVTVPVDDDGMRVDQLEPILKSRKIKIIYALPNFQNPAGTTIPLHRREKLAALAHAYGVPLVEDDPYGELRYEGEHLTPLVVFDERLGKNGRAFEKGDVIYTSTCSETLPQSKNIFRRACAGRNRMAACSSGLRFLTEWMRRDCSPRRLKTKSRLCRATRSIRRAAMAEIYQRGTIPCG